MFFVSDWLVAVNAHPLDAHFGHTAEPEMVEVTGELVPATQQLATKQEPHGPVLFSNLDTDEPSPQVSHSLPKCNKITHWYNIMTYLHCRTWTRY